MLENGQGGSKDEIMARALYAKADVAGNTSATFNLAVMLADGQGGPYCSISFVRISRYVSWLQVRLAVFMNPMFTFSCALGSSNWLSITRFKCV